MADETKKQGQQPNPTESAELLRLQAELASARAALSSKDDSLAAKERELFLLRNGIGPTTFVTTSTKPTWPFRVEPFDKSLTQLAPLVGEFVDESEAIRCFWVQNNGKKGINKRGAQINLDSTNVEVRCTCAKQAEREAGIRAQYRKKTPEEMQEHLIPSLN